MGDIRESHCRRRKPSIKDSLNLLSTVKVSIKHVRCSLHFIHSFLLKIECRPSVNADVGDLFKFFIDIFATERYYYPFLEITLHFNMDTFQKSLRCKSSFFVH